MATLEGQLIASGLRIAVLAARFNQFITERLVDGALDAFTRLGGDPASVDLVRVPGAFEMPVAAKRLAATGKYDALVALAAVIRGETSHFEYVASSTTNGLAGLALEFGIPIGNGVLTVESVEQAVDRAGAKVGNKGAEAMISAIEMANLLKVIA